MTGFDFKDGKKKSWCYFVDKQESSKGEPKLAKCEGGWCNSGDLERYRCLSKDEDEKLGGCGKNGS